MRRALAWCLGVVTIVLAGCGGSGSGIAVTGFQVADGPPAAIQRNAAAVGTVGVDGATLSGGRVVPEPGVSRQLRQARSDHLSAELVVNNVDPQSGTFSEASVHTLLSHPAPVVAQLAGLVRGQGWNGICVDFESLQARDRAGLVEFVRALRHALPADSMLSVAVPNATADSEFGAGAYSLAGLGHAADQLIMLGYDEHTQGDPAGPIGALGWERAGLRTVLRSVPPGKVELGVAGYGRAWRGRATVHLSDAHARALVSGAHAQARYDETAGEWTAKLPNGSTLWWSDDRSYQQRVALARAYHLQGVAVWSLDLSDPIARA